LVVYVRRPGSITAGGYPQCLRYGSGLQTSILNNCVWSLKVRDLICRKQSFGGQNRKFQLEESKKAMKLTAFFDYVNDNKKSNS
jgi:hypothetical protein